MAGAGELASRLLRQAPAATCGYAIRRDGKVDVNRTVAGVTVRAEVRSS